MSGFPPPPPYPPPGPPPGYDPRDQRRFLRDQARVQRDAWKAQRAHMRFQMRGYRRTSILGPILLIAVGIVFLLLQTGRLPHQMFWDWYGRWWPLLLVAGGIILLAEWAVDQFLLHDPEHPPYRRSIGGGVFTLLLIFGIVGVVTHEVHAHSPNSGWNFNGLGIDTGDLDQFLGDKHESDQTLDLDFPTGGSLAVVNPHGDVTLSGTSDDARIHIAVHKQIYTRTDAEADKKAHILEPAVATSGSAITLTLPAVEGARADLVITLPATAAATVTANHGDIHIASIKSSVTATANYGDIELSAITGPAVAHINNRDASFSAHSLGSGLTLEGHGDDVTLSDIAGPVSINGDFFGTTHLERIAGSVHFHTSRTDLQLARLDGEAEITRDSDLSADEAVGPFVLTTHNLNVTLDRIAGDISVTDHNGSINLAAATLSSSKSSGASNQLGAINLEDRNGSIKVTIPEHAGFSLQADTTDGDIDTDLSLATQSNGSHKIMTGSVAPGGPSVHIVTTNGDIAIHRGDVAALPAIPPAPPKLTLVPPPAPAKPHAK